MKKFTVQYPEMRVHKAGCRDIKRNMGDTIVTAEATNVAAFIARELGDWQDESTLAGMGYAAQDFIILPCAK